MTSSFTTNKHIEKPASGDYANTWATPVNADWDVIDNAFGGRTTRTTTTGSHTLTVAEYTPPILKVTGSLTGNVTYTLPAGVGGFWYIYNQTVDAGSPSTPYTVTFVSATGGGTTLVIPRGATTAALCDGTNWGRSDTNTVIASGSTTQVQFNSAGVLAGSASLTWDGTYLSARGLKLTGSTSGYVGLVGAAAAGSTIYTLPNTDGSNGQVLTTNGSSALSWTTVSGGGGTSGVTSFSAGTTGLNPSSASTGIVTLSGTLNVVNGGTGATSQSGAQTALNVPSTSGSGATGTWGINISGNAATATTAAYATTVTGTAFPIGYRQIPQSSNTTAAASDVGKHIYTSSGVTITTGVFAVGDAFVIVNSSASASMTIIQGSGATLLLANSTTTGNRTIAANGIANILCVATATFLVSGAGVT